MREIKSRIRQIIYLEWFIPKKVYVFLFWIGIIYLLGVIAYHIYQKGLRITLGYFLNMDVSALIGLLSIIGGLIFKQLEQTRRKEEKLKEIEVSPIDEASDGLLKFYPEAKKEGWLQELSEIVNRRREEFIEEVLRNKSSDMLKIISDLLEKDDRYEFLWIYVKRREERKEQEWRCLLENLPKWLETFGGQDNWRKVIYDEATECASYFSSKEKMEELWEEWYNQTYGRILLKVQGVCEKLTDDKRKLLGPRLEIRRLSGGKKPEIPKIEQWCREIGLNFNPFGPENAEEDPSLPDYYVEPDFWNDLLAPHPAIVLGPYGSGKSALALCLVDYLNRDYESSQGKTLGIPMSITEPISDSLIFSIIEAFALHTLELAAHNPFVFLESPQRLHFYRLWELFIPDIKAKLAAEGLREFLLASLIREMQNLEIASKFAHVSPQRFEELISPFACLLEEFNFTYLIVDVKGLTAKSNELTDWLRNWVSIMPLLLKTNFYPKIICLGNEKIIQQSGWEWDVFELEWDEMKLSKMVEIRVQTAGVASFKALFNPTLRWKDWALEMAKAAKGSPRQLIRIGNEILLRAANHLDSPPITEKDLKGILL